MGRERTKEAVRSIRVQALMVMNEIRLQTGGTRFVASERSYIAGHDGAWPSR
jgi:hypothetical protein